MRNNVIDIIIYLIEQIQVGEHINDIDLNTLKQYDRSEIGAAYSWVLQKNDSGELDKMIKRKKIIGTNKYPHRILHIAERMVITTEAYGFLLELMNIGLLDYESMEKIIEKVMLHSTERVSLNKIKEVVTHMFFENDGNPFKPSDLLRGDESIN
jgi:uncharacterized protein Smg (DUF494 family)